MSDSYLSNDGKHYLNIGCGRQFHSDWINLDLESVAPDVICHDVGRGIPFADATFEVVYHSHVLEHLNPEEGKRLIGECFRVLKPGGVLRVVVPDLERIALLYLEMHQQAWEGNADSKINYNWMKLELLDQLVRESSGGQMGRYMASLEIKNSEFVRERVGDELSVCQLSSDKTPSTPSLGQRLQTSAMRVRQKFAERAVRWLMGRKAEKAFREGYFRSQGEIHRWMYDRYSLKQLTCETGFEDFRVCEANESAIPCFNGFGLDCVGGRVRKPDSIFIECVRPTAVIREPKNPSLRPASSKSFQ